MRQKDGRGGAVGGEAQTDNIVILRLAEGQTRHRNKEEWNEMQNKGNVNICSAATGEVASETGGEKMAAARRDASRGRGAGGQVQTWA